MSDDKPQGPVAPADAHVKSDKDGKHEGVHPVLVNPDQPTFPHPVGVDRKDLEKAGVGHGYSVPGGEEPLSGPLFEEEKGAKDAGTAEGKAQDPNADEKAKKLAEQAAAAQKASGQ